MPFRIYRLAGALTAASLAASCGAPAPPQGASAPPAPAEPSPTPAAASAVVASHVVPAPGEIVFAAPVPSAEARAHGMEELRRGLALSRARDAAAAAQAFDRGAAAIPLLADWAQLLAADAAAQVGDTAGTRTRLEAAGPGLAVEWGWKIRELAQLAAGDTFGAARAIEEAAPGVDDPVRRAEAWRRAGDLHTARRETAAAAAAYRHAMAAAPQAGAALESARAVSSYAQLAAADQLLAGRVWLRHGQAERGSSLLDAYLATGMASPAERAQLRLEAGRALFRARSYAAAERNLVAAAREPAAAPAVAAEASFLAARSQFRQGRTEQARSTFLATADRFPGEDAAAQAFFTLGDLEHDAGRLGSAREYFRRAIATGTDAPDAAQAAMRLASMQYAARDYGGAAATLEEFVSGRPADRRIAQASFWAGRARLAAGERESGHAHLVAARQADPVSYYGMRANELLGSSFTDLDLAPAPEIAAATAAEVERALFRVDALRELEQNDASAFEMARTRARLAEQTGALYLVAEGLIERHAPVQGILLGREILRREGSWNERLLRIVYPFPHRAIIEAEARRQGLDPFVVAGLIRQESMFNPIAVSPAGAVGLMQVMPATGRGLARGAGITNFDPQLLKRPETNVRLGTLFLADLQRRYGGRLTDVFAAYNAGPGRLVRWRTLPEYPDEELFAERIPFQETRDYVKIVRFNAQLYRMLYGGQMARR